MTHRASARALAIALLLPTALLAQGTKPDSAASHDSAHAAMQRRGAEVMGVDQETSTHSFVTLPNGGLIELQSESGDSVGMRAIRAHLRGIAQAFSAGDFSAPSYVHMTTVPGAQVMAQRHNVIRYDYRDLPRGGSLRISTSDFTARRAIGEFIAYQRMEHMAGERPD
jgi:hypothetical protein